jgi:uncharacterized phage protein (TIGR02220 family)
MAGFTTVSNDLLDNDELNIQEQALLLAIISYSGKGFANPSYKGLKLRSKIRKDETLIKTINSLIEKKYIEINSAKGKKNIYKLTPKTEVLRKWSNTENGGAPTPKTEVLPTPKTEYKKEREKERENIYIPILEYLNEKADTNFRASSKKTKSLIDARLKEGFTKDDFQKVIDTKVLEWKNDETMAKYIRPETLFGNKFEGYLNQKSKGKTNGASEREYEETILI